MCIWNFEFRSLVRVLYEGDAKFNIQGQLASDVNSVNEKSRAQMVFDYFAFAENDALTGVKVTDALEFTEFASRDTDKETSSLIQKLKLKMNYSVRSNDMKKLKIRPFGIFMLVVFLIFAQ